MEIIISMAIVNKKLAFTLGEIILTITIIGIVASMTIPSLINNIDNQQYKILWKKIYADINNASNLIIAQRNMPYPAYDQLFEEYKKYLSFTKKLSEK